MQSSHHVHVGIDIGCGVDWQVSICRCGEIAGPVGWCRECLVERLGEDERGGYEPADEDE